MKNNVQRFATVLALALLVLGPATLVLAQEPAAEAETTLTGQLSGSSIGGYVLVESEGGEEISLKGSDDLSEHLGAEVHVTGRWAQDEDGSEYFAVSSVERVSSE